MPSKTNKVFKTWSGLQKHLIQTNIIYKQKLKKLEQQIDNEIYKLYGLTDEEIKIIEQ